MRARARACVVVLVVVVVVRHTGAFSVPVRIMPLRSFLFARLYPPSLRIGPTFSGAAMSATGILAPGVSSYHRFGVSVSAGPPPPRTSARPVVPCLPATQHRVSVAHLNHTAGPGAMLTRNQVPSDDLVTGNKVLTTVLVLHRGAPCHLPRPPREGVVRLFIDRDVERLVWLERVVRGRGHRLTR